MTNPVTNQSLGVFSHGSAFTYNAQDNDPAMHLNRDDNRDVFMEEVLHQRFSKHLHILMYYQKKDSGAHQRVYADSPLRMDGVPQVGQRLTAAGWYCEKDHGGCSYQWFSEGDAIPGANSNTYVVQERDSGKEVSCRVTYGEEHQDIYTRILTPVVDEGPRGFELTDLTVKGGPDHLCPIEVVATYSDGLDHPGEIQWYRADSMGGEYLAVKHRTHEIYNANADDLHCLHYVYYKVLEGNSAGQVAKGIVHPHFLSINHDVATEVEKRVRAGTSTWDLETQDGTGRRIVTVTNHKLTITDPNFKKDKANPKAKATVETKHHGAIRVLLHMTEETHFNLSVPPNEPYKLKAASRAERDIIAITIRSFVGKVVTNYESTKNKHKKLHTTHSIAELGHEDKYAAPPADQNTAVAA